MASNFHVDQGAVRRWCSQNRLAHARRRRLTQGIAICGVEPASLFVTPVARAASLCPSSPSLRSGGTVRSRSRRSTRPRGRRQLSATADMSSLTRSRCDPGSIIARPPVTIATLGGSPGAGHADQVRPETHAASRAGADADEDTLFRPRASGDAVSICVDVRKVYSLASKSRHCRESRTSGAAVAHAS